MELRQFGLHGRGDDEPGFAVMGSVRTVRIDRTIVVRASESCPTRLENEVNMTCCQLEALIDEYLEGSLDERQRYEFSRHLEACGVCDHYASGYVGTIDLAKAALVNDSESQSGLSEEAVASFMAALRHAMHRDDGSP